MDLKVRFCKGGAYYNRPYRNIQNFIDSISDEDLPIQEVQANFSGNYIKKFPTMASLKEYCEYLIQNVSKAE